MYVNKTYRIINKVFEKFTLVSLWYQFVFLTWLDNTNCHVSTYCNYFEKELRKIVKNLAERIFYNTALLPLLPHTTIVHTQNTKVVKTHQNNYCYIIITELNILSYMDVPYPF